MDQGNDDRMSDIYIYIFNQTLKTGCTTFVQHSCCVMLCDMCCIKKIYDEAIEKN